MNSKKNIRTLSLEELTEYFKTIGEKKFRTKQVWEWLWQKHATSFEDMTNLSKELRQSLSANFSLPAINTDATQYSSDGTVKTRFKTFDGHLVEGVLIPVDNRQTACVSSQVGCSLSCKFCATGYMDKKRNLHFDEIYDEVVLLNQMAEKTYGKKLSNIVFMGMGEPLLNYKNVLKAIERITANDGLGMSAKRITVSTAGVAKMIKQLGDDGVKFNLALSLHAANDKKRNEIMPINESNNIKSLIEALNYFYDKTKNDITFEYILFKGENGVKFNLALSLHAANDKKRNEIMPINESNNIKSLIEALNYFYDKTKNDITFEYILFKGENDSIQDADDLIKIYKQVPVHLINIIEYNPIDNASFVKPDKDATQKFMDYLAAHRVNVRLRISRGKDIDAACGQLANKDLEPSVLN